jgi:predicted DNA-binding transcriptional regulator AlpA
LYWKNTNKPGVNHGGDGYLRLKEVLSVYPVSRAAWYEGMRTGIYPQSVPLPQGVEFRNHTRVHK